MALPAAAQDNAPVLLVVGDSVSAGYGLPGGKVWVDLLAAKLKAERLPLPRGQRVDHRRHDGRRTRAAARAPHAAQAGDRRSSSWAATTRCAAASSRRRADNLDAMVADGAGGARAGADRRHAAAAELRPRLRARVQRRSSRTSRRRARCRSSRTSSPASATTSRTSSPTASIRPRKRSRGCSTTYGRRSQPLLQADEAAGTRGRRRQGRHRRAGRRIRCASTCAARPSSRDDHIPGRDQPAGARRRASARKSARCTRSESAFDAKQRGAAIVARNIARIIEAHCATSRATGRRSSTAGAAASAAARSRTC